MRRYAILVAVAVVALSCGRGEAPSTRVGPTPAPAKGPSRGGTVVVGTLAGVENWNPYLTDTATSEDVLMILYPTLAVEQVDYRDHPPTFAPGLAASWEFSDDGLTLTFHLKKDARWSDGVPVTSRDVVFSWMAQTSDEVGWGGMETKKSIASVNAIDPHTVVFRFTRTYPYQMMDANEGQIIPAHTWEQIPFSQWERIDWAAHALSAGPFKLASNSPQQQFILDRNPYYWRKGLPRLDRVVWRILPDQGNLLTQLKTGAIDFMEGIPPREAEHVRGHPRLQLISFPDRSYAYVGWNLRRAPFNDLRVRQALTEGINRTAILDTELRGFGRPCVGPILSTMWAFNRNLKPARFDPAVARQLLADAGWKDRDGDGILDRNGQPLKFEIMTNAGNEVREDICLLIRDQLRTIGVGVTPRFVEWGSMLSQLEHGKFEAYVNAWREGTQVDLQPLWHSASPGVPTYNWGGYSNPEVDRLIDRARLTPTLAARKPMYDRIQALIAADLPYTFLYEGDRLDGLNVRVHNAVINDASPFFNIDEWYVSEPAR